MQPSSELKQSFRTVGLWATFLVVLIHYRSAATLGSGINGWAQEVIINGLARVAVPLFAFAAGFFYFLSATGTLRNYLQKLRQRFRSVLIPYLLASIVAFSCWSIMQLLLGRPTQLGWADVASRIFLHPMAEQLWFLRDLIVLVIAAPLIHGLVRRIPRTTLGTLALLWAMEWQPMPVVAGWYALNVETLFFFSLGCYGVTHIELLERWIRLPARSCLLLASIGGLLLSARVAIDPTLDLWYVREFSTLSLLLQKGAIVAGGLALLSLSRFARSEHVNRLGQHSFFVYLVHEFPLRELLKRLSGKLVADDYRFWIAAPAAIFGSFALAWVAARWAPTMMSILTGGRTKQPSVVADRFRSAAN